MTLYDDRLRLAHEIATRVRNVHSENVLAIGLHGSMAHGPDAVDHRSDLDLLVVARDPSVIAEREIFFGDVFISMGVASRDDYLKEADGVSWHWAMASDQYVNALSLHDPDGFFELVSETHERAVARFTEADFLRQCRDLVMSAYEYLGKGERCLENGVFVAAEVCAWEALITIALSIGLFTRTRWRGSHTAVAAAAEAGRAVVPGFGSAFDEAVAVDVDTPRRIAAAHSACDALRSHFERLGAPSKVHSVEELVR